MIEPTVSSAASRVLASLLEARTGQLLSPARSWRIEASLKPLLRQEGLTSIDALVGRMTKGSNPKLANQAVEALLNNETSFFRDATAFNQLEMEALESLRNTPESLRKNCAVPRRLRIWSTACSTGQEAYSLAMMLRDGGLRWAGWTFDILATDVSSEAVERAKEGRFSRFEIQRGLPVRTMLRWFHADGEEWMVDPALKRDIRFATHDVRNPAPGRFNLILCRNVLMYFPVFLRRQVFERLADALDPGGMIMLGAGETVLGQTDRFVSHPEMRGLYMAAADVSQSPLRVASR